MKKALKIVVFTALFFSVISFSFAQNQNQNQNQNLNVQATTSTQNVLPKTVITRACPYGNFKLENLRYGKNSPEVKILQEILSQDEEIYPQKLNTGYFGDLTREAVRNMQRKLGLPQTGVIDENFARVVFPCIELTLTLPNGGETWKVGETQKITWKYEPIYYIHEQGATREATESEIQALPQNTIIKPIYQNVAIDLVRTDLPRIMIYPPVPNPVVYHIGKASISDESFSWIIPTSIENSAHYKVRISVRGYGAPEINCLNTTDARCLSSIIKDEFKGFLWDESDNEFSILNPNMIITTAPTTTPVNGNAERIRELIRVFEELIARLQNILNNLKEQSPTPIPTQSCQNLWWYDNDHLYCQQKQFCGAYMYLGLHTFPTEEQCKADLGGPVCIQVITPAKDPKTGECRNFPTPCDVPSGWIKVSSCLKNQLF